MNKKELRRLGMIILILAILLIIYCIVFTILEEHNRKSNANIIIDGTRYLSYENKKWRDLQTIESIKMNEFKIYINNNYINTYFITETNKKIYFFDSTYQSYKVQAPFIAINKDSNVGLIDYQTASITDEDTNIINKYLKSVKIEYSGTYSTMEKYITDLNADEEEDYIYILCNELYSDNPFYIVFAKVGYKNITINKQINNSNLEKYELIWILTTKQKGYNDIILKTPSLESYDYHLYRYNSKKEYKEILNQKD